MDFGQISLLSLTGEIMMRFPKSNCLILQKSPKLFYMLVSYFGKERVRAIDTQSYMFVAGVGLFLFRIIVLWTNRVNIYRDEPATNKKNRSVN